MLAVLALLALASRLWVPAGFMPVAQAELLTLAICNPQGGGYTVVIDTGSSDSALHEGAAACPYCLLLSAGGPAPDLAASVLRYTALTMPVVRAGAPDAYNAVQGPPLGQRAPPAQA